MDICFYCYFLFSCVPQQFKFYEADRMRRTTNGEKEKKTKDLFVGKSLMCNHKLLNDEEEKTQKNFKAFRRKNWILFTLFGFARLLSIQVIRAHAHTLSTWLAIIEGSKNVLQQNCRINLSAFSFYLTLSRENPTDKTESMPFFSECEHLQNK